MRVKVTSSGLEIFSLLNISVSYLSRCKVPKYLTANDAIFIKVLFLTASRQSDDAAAAATINNKRCNC